MNKLLVSDIIDLSNGVYDLTCQNKELEINILGDVTIYLINTSLELLKINLNKESNLTVYHLNFQNLKDLKVDVYQNNDSKIIFNSTFINDKNRDLLINNYINGNNNVSKLNIRCISKKDLAQVIINVFVKSNTKNNIALEDLKGINNGGLIHIEPNIVASSNEVIANHLTTIGGLNKDELNYLLSKKISEEESKKLLLNSFIYGNMDDYIKKESGGE